MNAKEIKQKIALSPLFSILSMFRAGFELETQSFCNHNSDDLNESGFDDESFDNAVREETDNDLSNPSALYSSCTRDRVLREALNNYALEVYKEELESIGITEEIPEEYIDVIEQLENNREYDLYDFIIRQSLSITELYNMDHLDESDYEDIRDRIEENNRDNMDRDDYYTDSNFGESVENVADYWDDRFIVHRDGSVDGPEIVTPDGGVTIPEFVNMAKTLFKNSMNIDDGCSFHIHLSVNGMEHYYGERFQLSLYEFLLDNIKLVPRSVIDRWQAIPDDRDQCHFFRPRLSRDKYSFVYKHNQGTWEFRCFGNIDNASDAKTCLLLAVQAMQYAYRVQLGMQQPIIDLNRISKDSVQELCIEAIDECRPLSEIVDALDNDQRAA